MNNPDKDTEPRIITRGYEVVAINCPDPAAACELAKERIREISDRVAAITAERTELNRETHVLLKWVYNAEEKAFH